MAAHVVQFLFGRPVPDLNGAVRAACGDEVTCECDGTQVVPAVVEYRDAGPRRRVPDANGTVEATGGELCSVVVESHGADPVSVLGRLEQLMTAQRVPQPDRVVPRRGGQHRFAWLEIHPLHSLGVTVKHLDTPFDAHVPDANRPVVTGAGEELAVVAER